MKQKTGLSFIVLFLIFCTLVTLSGCQNRNTSTFRKLREKRLRRKQNTLITSAHPQYQPVMWKADTKIVGIGPDIIQLLFADFNIAVESNYTGPWTRVLENCKYGKIDAISALYYTSERSESFDYTISYMVDPVAVFIKKGRTITFEKWEDLASLKGVTTKGDSWGEDFDLYMEEKLDVIKVSRVQQCFRMITAERADYMIFSLYSGLSQIKRYDFSHRIIPLQHHVSEPALHIGFSKLSPYRKYIPDLNKRITELKEDGTIDLIIDSYLAR